MTTMQGQDVVDLLLDQHEQLKGLFNEVQTAQGEQKREAFERLVRLLAVHESAEELVVHPAAKRGIEQGGQVVEAREREEHEAKQALAELYDLGVDHPDFDRKLKMLADAVIEHATREEREEFGPLREKIDAERLRRMTGAVQAAEAVAPTRAHPKLGESATANLIAGPPTAVFDRTRDAVRDWRETHGKD